MGEVGGIDTGGMLTGGIGVHAGADLAGSGGGGAAAISSSGSAGTGSASARMGSGHGSSGGWGGRLRLSLQGRAEEDGVQHHLGGRRWVAFAAREVLAGEVVDLVEHV